MRQVYKATPAPGLHRGARPDELPDAQPDLRGGGGRLSVPAQLVGGTSLQLGRGDPTAWGWAYPLVETRRFLVKVVLKP